MPANDRETSRKTLFLIYIYTYREAISLVEAPFVDLVLQTPFSTFCVYADGEQATLSPLASKLYYGKGKSLFLRSYKGDTYEALIHAEVSIYLDSLNLQAQLLRIQCLEALSWFEEALEHLTLLQGAQLTSEPRIEKYLVRRGKDISIIL